MIKLATPTDEHRPFHDPHAVELAMKLTSEYDPDILVVGSDGVDFYSISKFEKIPNFIKGGLNSEVESWIEGQKEWRDAAPNARRKWIIGNHEFRLERFLRNHPELYDLEILRMSEILKLDMLGIEDCDYEVVVENTLLVTHGTRVSKHSAYTARAEAENQKFSINTLTGHTHRGGLYITRTRKGIVQAAEGFCLCSLEPEYVRNPDWQQGIVFSNVENGVVSHELIPFHSKGKHRFAYWRGKEYRV